MTTKDLSKKFGLTEESRYDKLMREFEAIRSKSMETGKIIITSTPSGINNFYKMYKTSYRAGFVIPDTVIIY